MVLRSRPTGLANLDCTNTWLSDFIPHHALMRMYVQGIPAARVFVLYETRHRMHWPETSYCASNYTKPGTMAKSTCRLLLTLTPKADPKVVYLLYEDLFGPVRYQHGGALFSGGKALCLASHLLIRGKPRQF